MTPTQQAAMDAAWDLAVLKASELMSPNEMGYDALLDRLYEEELDKLESQTEGE